MDFQAILAATKATDNYNLHSHTQFCDGRDSMAQLAQAACATGMTLWGITPHSPMPEGFHTSCNMERELVAPYLAEANRLKELYRGKMTVLTSMEIDFVAPGWGAFNDYFQSLPLDYRLSSVHFIRNQRGELIDIDGRPEKFLKNLHEGFRGDLQYVVQAYFGAQAEMLDRGGFDMIGHPDKVRLNASFADADVERRDYYLDALEEVLQMIEQQRVCVEINTKHYEMYSTLFPSEAVVERLLKSSVPLVVNSDAHYAAKVNASRSAGLALLPPRQ